MNRTPGHLTKKIDNAASSLVWIKIVGIGNASVGKTCLIKHFCESKFTGGYQPTVGVDYGFKIQNVQGKDVRIHLWDLSGHTEYLDVRNELYSNVDGVFLVYDITNQASFDNLDIWMKELTKYAGPVSDICLVANKVDQKAKRSISSNEGKKWANQHNIQYYETACSTGEGVEKMFVDLLTSILKRKRIKNS